MAEKSPPFSNEAEMSVLGALLVSGDAWHEVSSVIQATDFFRAAHGKIFAAIARLHGHGHPVDLVTVTSDIMSRGELQESGGASYLAELVVYVPTAANAGHYAKVVSSKATLRRVILAAREIEAQAMAATDADGLMADAFRTLEGISQSCGQADAALLTLPQMAEMYREHVKSLGKRRFVTGFADLDGIIRGVAPGEVMMITAYSGLYKSALLQNLLLGACHRTGEHHLFFSLEMPATRVFERTVQIATEDYTYHIESMFHHHQGKPERVMETLHTLGADKMIVCERPALTIEQVEHYARLARARYGAIGAVGIDYLGLMAADGKDREYDRISYVAENSKHLAKRLNVPVIILTQIDRTSARLGQVEKFSAKGSGAIEASADYMLALMKDADKRLLLKILKNRNGEENLSFDVDIDAKYLKFRSMTPHDDVAAKNAQRGASRVRREYADVRPVEVDPY
jgi:replicative DNA helicase